MKEVIDMEHKHGEKIQLRRAYNRKGPKPNVLRRLLFAFRLLRTSREVEEPSRVPKVIERAGFPASHRCNYGREVETALLEEERKRAYALMAGQKLRFIG